MRNPRARRWVLAVASGLAVVAVAATGVAMALTPSLGLLADATTTKAVKFDDRLIRMKTKVPIRVRNIHVGRADGFNSGWHSHPGPEIIAVKEGTLTVTVASGRGAGGDDDEGEDDEERGSPGGSCESTTLTAGQAFVASPNVPFVITASGPIEFVATLLLPVGPPISTPADPPC
jgi:hypothetical protein